MKIVTVSAKQFLTIYTTSASARPKNRFLTPTTTEMVESYCTTFHKQLQVNKDSTLGIAAIHESEQDKYLHYICFYTYIT
jgi:hypothetical protein